MVELSLSIAFIAILSIIVMLVISNAVSAYHRGLTMNQLNTTGMDLVDDFRTTIQASPARSLKNECASMYSSGSNALTACEADNGHSFMSLAANGPNGAPSGGVFCTGAYSYIWNSGYSLKDNSTSSKIQLKFAYSRNKDGSSGTKDDPNFRLWKVADDNRVVCKNAAGVASGSYSTTMGNSIDLTCGGASAPNVDACRTMDEEGTDVLEGNKNMAIYSLSVPSSAVSNNSNTMLYSVSMILGTIQGGINVRTAGNFCSTPEGYSSEENFDYCAINKFNFAATASGG